MKRMLVALGLAAGLITSAAQAQDIPTIRVGWTIPAEEAKYWMMRRPQEFPDLGKAYKIEWSPEAFRASAVLERGAGYCVTKAVLLTAAGRAAGLPARLGFADVRNHVATPALERLMETDLFVYHGYTEFWIGGRWVKTTPAFPARLCRRLGVPPLEFDGRDDSIFHPFDAEGHRHMEYLRDHGHFADFPLEGMVAAFKEHYPHLFQEGTAWPQGNFEQEALTDG